MGESDEEFRWTLENWTQLADDEEILSEIVDHIDSHLDLCKFRSVCRSWRSPAHATSRFLFSSLPLQIPVYDYHFKLLMGCEDRLKFLVGSVVYLIQPINQEIYDSPKFWVVCLEELNPGLLKFRYPLTKTPIENLPHDFPKSINSLNFRVSIIGKGFKFCFANGDEDVFHSESFDQGFQNWSDFPTKTKIILFSEKELKNNYDHSFAVLILNFGGILGFMRQGEWRFMRNASTVYFDDIVSCKGGVYAIDRRGVLYAISNRESRLMKAITTPVHAGDDGINRRKLLAESKGKLYMIVRDGYKVRVYKLSVRRKVWNEVNRLNGRILFVTFDGCYFVEANEIVGCRGNCIFFPKNCFPNYLNGYHPDDHLFKVASKFEVGVFYLNEDCCRLVSSDPDLADMFWPPPSWVWPDSSSFTWEFEDNEQEEDYSNQKDIQSKNLDDLIPRKDWSELPKELLKMIAGHLDTQVDCCKFRSICKRWHSCGHLPSRPIVYSQLPHNVDSSYMFEKSDQSIFLVPRITYVLRPLDHKNPNSAKPWIMTVEDLNFGLQLCHPLSKIPFKNIPVNFPKHLNLFEFKVSRISIGLKFCDSKGDEKVFSDHGISTPWSDFPNPAKVILFSESLPTATSIDDCIAVVLFLHLGGSFATFHLRTNQWSNISLKNQHCYDDIVVFKGYVCAVDRAGVAYLVDVYTMTIVAIITRGLGNTDENHQKRRKLLVESYGELYMIVRSSCDFRVYKLNEELHCWYQVNDLGGRILFVSFDRCFFVDAKDFPGCRGNCIVFPKNCFPQYSGGYDPDYELFQGVRHHLTIGVFYLNENRCKLLSSYPALSELFWPPPSWICPDTLPHRVSEANNEPINSSKQIEPNYEDEETVEEDSEMTSQGDDDLYPSTIASFAISDIPSMKKFRGVDVRSDLVPYLRKLWKKDDFIDENVVLSKGLLTWAFESLAKMMIILQNNRGKENSSLSESESEYLNTTLVDLQFMKFRLDWLVPIVEKATARYNSKEPEDAVMELQLERNSLLSKVHKLEEKLNEQKKLVELSQCSLRN